MVNVIICGTPGTGKSTLVERLKPKLTEFNFVNISQFAVENQCIESYDETLETKVIDDDKLADSIEKLIEERTDNVFECINSDLLVDVDDKINLVFVCRADNTKLYDRLKARGYNDLKLKNNLEAEIFQTILDEALAVFGREMVTELVNNEESDIDKNIDIVMKKILSLEGK